MTRHHACVVLLLAGTRLPAQAAPIVIPLTPYANTSLRTVQARINGDTGTFIFDTGGGVTLVDATRALAAGCLPFGRLNGARANGERVISSRCAGPVLEVGGFRYAGELAVYDLATLLGPQAPPVAGLIGLNAFAGRAITLDLARDRVLVETPSSLARRVRQMRPVNVRLATGPGGEVDLFLEVRARTGTLWMGVDSGNNGPVFIAPHALVQLGLDRDSTARRTVALDVTGLGPVTVDARRAELIYDGLLNPAFLRALVLTVDFATHRAWAVRNRA